MTLHDFASGALHVLSPILVAALTWVATKVSQLINARVQNERLQNILARVDDTVFAVVRELQQVTVDKLKAAAVDGKLTSEAKEMLRLAAIASIRQQLGTKGVSELSQIVGVSDRAIDNVLVTHIEAAVLDLRRAHVTNGVNKPGPVSVAA
jgi:hypothetical protein